MTAERLYFTQRGAGPPLLLVHGLMITGEMFDGVVDQFASHRRVIVPDLRGHGRSRGLPGPYTASQHAADLIELLEGLGIASADVVGYSHGGAVAQQLAVDAPATCNRLVLACTYAFNMATARERLEGNLVPLLLRALGTRRFARLVASQGLTKLPPERARWVEELMADQDRGTMVMAWKDAMAFDGRGGLGRIQSPTLILAAAEDEAVPRHHAVALHDGIRESELVYVQGATHSMVWTHPAEFVSAVEAFLG